MTSSQTARARIAAASRLFARVPSPALTGPIRAVDVPGPRLRIRQRIGEEIIRFSPEFLQDVEVTMHAGLMARERRLGAGRRPIRRLVGEERMPRRAAIGLAVGASLVAVVIAVSVSLWWRYFQRVSPRSTTFGRVLKPNGDIVTINFGICPHVC